MKSAARPPSARRPAPRLKEKNEVLEDDAVQQRPQTGKVANVIVDDGNHDNDDDADEFLVEEKPKDNLDLDTENTTFDANVSLISTFFIVVQLFKVLSFQNMRLENGEHGALVQQILDTKKELEDGATTTKKGVEIEKDAGFSDFNLFALWFLFFFKIELSSMVDTSPICLNKPGFLLNSRNLSAI